MAEKESLPDLPRLDVMIVEENAQFRRLLRKLLRDFGINLVRETSDGYAALKEMISIPADLVICGDWSGPAGGDILFVRALRSATKPAVARSPVILITARANAQHAAQARDAGADEFLVKPVSPKALHARILAALAKPRPCIEAERSRGQRMEEAGGPPSWVNPTKV